MEIIIESTKEEIIPIKITSTYITGIYGKNYHDFLNLLSLNNLDKEKIIINRIKVDKKNKSSIKDKISYVSFELKKEESIASVREYMEYIMQEKFIKVKDSNKKLKDSLKIVGLSESYLNKSINILSKSELKLIQIAISLLSNPEIIILDEPFKFLDNKNTKKIYMLFQKLKDQYNKVIVVASTDTNTLYKYTEEIILLKGKNILMTGKTKDVLENVSFLNKEKIEPPDSVKFIYKAKKNKIKLDYNKDIRDIIKDIYKHV